VILGRRGMGEIRDALFGAVSNHVMHRALPGAADLNCGARCVIIFTLTAFDRLAVSSLSLVLGGHPWSPFALSSWQVF
jgi:hypothetical protein